LINFNNSENFIKYFCKKIEKRKTRGVSHTHNYGLAIYILKSIVKGKKKKKNYENSNYFTMPNK